MNCDTFRSWIDRMQIMSPEQWPETVRTHHEACADCQTWLAHEQTWQHVFAQAPMPRARPSVWPGVMAAIAARQAQPISLSRELVSLSRYLVPALAVLVLTLSGVGLWGQIFTQNIDLSASVLVAESNTELVSFSRDADTILDQWVGVSQ